MVEKDEMNYDMQEMKQQSSNISSLFTGFLIGGLIGAAAAFLMAPQSGEDTRTMLRDKSVEIRDKAKSTAEDTRSRTEQMIADARGRAQQTVHQISKGTQDITNTARDRIVDTTKRTESQINDQLQS